MTSMFDNEDREFFVVVNDEEQYSIWPSDREIPAGWNAVGSPRSRADCLAWIEQNWTDMRPKSLREAMEKEQ
jgi:MbtH protein